MFKPAIDESEPGLVDAMNCSISKLASTGLYDELNAKWAAGTSSIVFCNPNEADAACAARQQK
jgi:hypothetical protein